MARAMATQRPGDSAGDGQLEHLTGARCLAALWIVCGHFVPPQGKGNAPPSPLLNSAVYRLNVAVCFFVVMSGFVTHWAYGALELRGPSDYLKFYLRRIGKVLPTFWLAMFAGTIVLKIQEYKPIDNPWYVAGCYFMVEQWVTWCPNGPSWFVFALIPAWLLYPLTRLVVRTAESWGGALGLVLLTITWFIISFAPGFVVFVRQGYYLDIGEHFAWSFSPPSQLADFGIGVAMAALAKRMLSEEAFLIHHDKVADASVTLVDGTPASRRTVFAAAAADLSLSGILAAVFLVPQSPQAHEMNRIGYEPLFDHALTPLVACFLCSSAVAAGQGLSVKFLSHRALVALGFCSFEAYIFQRPVHDFFIMVFDEASGQAFFAFVLLLWLYAMLYAKYVQPIFDSLLRRLIRFLFDPSGDMSPTTPGAFGGAVPQPVVAGQYAPVAHG